VASIEQRIERLEGLKQLIEKRVEARVEEELAAAIHSLEQHLTREELRGSVNRRVAYVSRHDRKAVE
jgi:hypothetical protein